jgi:hypothetical protein
MTKPRLALALFVCTGLLLAAAPARAQAGFGVRTGVSVDPDQFYLGAHVGVGPLVGHLWFRPSVEIGFGDNVTLVALNPELAYWFPSKSAWRLYVGGGPALNIYDYDSGSETKGGLNFLLGVAHRGGFFVEGKLGVFDSPELKFGFGYTF